MEGDTVEDPGKWYLQYVGLVWKGKKVIYISAISRKVPTQFRIDPANNVAEEVPTDSWKTKAVVICDGGTNWGVIYDPASRKFSHLAVNGVG